MFHIVPSMPSVKINEDGVVMCAVSNKIKKPCVDKDGYWRVSVKDQNGKYLNKAIHRLLAEVFIPNPEEKPQVNHIDSNRQNNKTSNLEWVTAKENYHHGRTYGAIKCYGEESPSNVYSVEKVKRVCGLLQEGVLPLKHIARDVGVHEMLVCDIKKRKAWAWLSKDYTWSPPKEGLTDEVVEEICAMFTKGATYKEILSELTHPRLNRHTLRHIKNKNTFKHITMKYDWKEVQRSGRESVGVK